MQPSALMLPDCQWRAFDGAPFAIDQDILAHTEPSVSLRHWKRVVASIPRPFKRACHGPPPSGHLHLPPSFHCFAWTRSIRRVAQLGRIFDPKQQEKAAGFGEKQRPGHISGTRYCVHKKDQDVLSAGLRRASHRRLESRHCRQSRKELGWSQDRQVPLWSRRANRSLGRPGGSANLPTKIQAVPAAAPSLSLLAALGFICGDNPPPPQLWALQLFSSPQQYPTYHLPKATSRNLLTTRYKTETIDPPCNQSSSNLRKSRSKTYTATKNTASAVRQAKRRGNPLAELEKEHRDTGAGHLGDHDPATHESLSLTRVASQTAFFELSRHLRRGGGRIEGETQKGGPAERLRRRSDSSLERPLNNNKHIVISRRTAPVGRAV